MVGVILTTNHKDALYLEPNDRRYSRKLVADAAPTTSSPTTSEEYWAWLEDGGDGHVLAYLLAYDLSGFDPKAPPPEDGRVPRDGGGVRAARDGRRRQRDSDRPQTRRWRSP